MQQGHKGDYKSELDYGKESVTDRMVLTLNLTRTAAFVKREQKQNMKEGTDHVRKRRSESLLTSVVNHNLVELGQIMYIGK